jgi:hypothetical protein
LNLLLQSSGNEDIEIDNFVIKKKSTMGFSFSVKTINAHVTLLSSTNWLLLTPKLTQVKKNDTINS